jgi:hypothetical protein
MAEAREPSAGLPIDKPDMGAVRGRTAMQERTAEQQIKSLEERQEQQQSKTPDGNAAPQNSAPDEMSSVVVGLALGLAL